MKSSRWEKNRREHESEVFVSKISEAPYLCLRVEKEPASHQCHEMVDKWRAVPDPWVSDVKAQINARALCTSAHENTLNNNCVKLVSKYAENDLLTRKGNNTNNVTAQIMAWNNVPLCDASFSFTAALSCYWVMSSTTITHLSSYIQSTARLSGLWCVQRFTDRCPDLKKPGPKHATVCSVHVSLSFLQLTKPAILNYLLFLVFWCCWPLTCRVTVLWKRAVYRDKYATVHLTETMLKCGIFFPACMLWQNIICCSSWSHSRLLASCD